MTGRATRSFAAVATLFLTLGAANAAAIYEPFDYSAGAMDGSSQAGGTGLTGAWSGGGAQADWDVVSGGLVFTGLSTTGNHASRGSGQPGASGNAETSRAVTAPAISALTADNTTIYFSVLMRDDQYSSGNANGAMLFGTGAITDPSTDPVALAGGEAVGVSFNKGTLAVRGVVVDGGVSSFSTGFLDDGDLGTLTTYLIVGKLDWKPNGTNDTLTLYNIADVNAPLPTEFATMTFDVDQTLFDTLALGSRQVGDFDEIRFDTTLSGVGVIPEPTSLALFGLSGLLGLRRRRRA